MRLKRIQEAHYVCNSRESFTAFVNAANAARSGFFLKSKTKPRRKHASLSSYADPAYFFVNPKRDKAACRKLAQLCAAVESSLASSLMCESANPLFDELSLICVRPEIGAARLLVTLATPQSDIDEVRRALMSARGFFRAHLARDLSRKKVPQLSFAVIPASCAESELYD